MPSVTIACSARLGDTENPLSPQFGNTKRKLHQTTVLMRNNIPKKVILCVARGSRGTPEQVYSDLLQGFMLATKLKIFSNFEFDDLPYCNYFAIANAV